MPQQSPCPSPSGSERAATATPLDTASNAEDTSSNGNKDEEDDDADDDNDDDKIDAQYDPERLKAFNVRNNLGSAFYCRVVACINIPHQSIIQVNTPLKEGRDSFLSLDGLWQP